MDWNTLKFFCRLHLIKPHFMLISKYFLDYNLYTKMELFNVSTHSMCPPLPLLILFTIQFNIIELFCVKFNLI